MHRWTWAVNGTKNSGRKMMVGEQLKNQILIDGNKTGSDALNVEYGFIYLFVMSEDVRMSSPIIGWGSSSLSISPFRYPLQHLPFHSPISIARLIFTHHFALIDHDYSTSSASEQSSKHGCNAWCSQTPVFSNGPYWVTPHLTSVLMSTEMHMTMVRICLLGQSTC